MEGWSKFPSWLDSVLSSVLGSRIGSAGGLIGGNARLLYERNNFRQGPTAIPVRNGTLTKQILLKWCHFERAKPTLKILLAFWTFDRLWNGIRSLNAENLDFIDQRATKLLAVKLWEWFDPGRPQTRADRPCTHFGWIGRRGRFFLESSNFDSW